MDVFLNTSNKGKLAEFQQLFAQFGISLQASNHDLAEIAADPISVMAHKASCLQDLCLVDDTSLEVEGAEVGINIRWLLKDLQNHLGKKATWTVLLGHKKGGKVYLYQGQIEGSIVSPQGEGGFGFDPYFQPVGSTKTLAQHKPPQLNARALAVADFVNQKVFQIHKPIENWQGEWQHED
ncbi:MAG: non-canonical purine NTP pyrophosphatase [Oligoflexales bacterium]|nr:non-canonical purine NTP pyrophosphatase [Oligoflexales bacterium]